MHRAVRLGPLLLLLPLLTPSAAAVQFSGSIVLGKVDGGSKFQLGVLIDNAGQNFSVSGTYDTAVSIPQGYTQADVDALPAWIQTAPTGVTNWSVEAGANTTFLLNLAVPTGAHSGPYLFHTNFLETQRTPSGGGSVVGVSVNHVVPVSFIVRGVDVVGRIAIPPVLKPESQLPPISLAMANYLSNNITGSPLMEVYLRDGGNLVLKRTFDLEDAVVPASSQGTTKSFEFQPDFRGLPIGEYVLRTWAHYTVDGDSGARDSRPKEQTLVIGITQLTFTGHRINTTLGAFGVAEGGQVQLPRKIDAALEVDVANVGDLLATALLSLHVQKRGGEAEGTTTSLTIPKTQLLTASLAFKLPSEGTYDLELSNEGTPLWNGTVEAAVPQVSLKGPSLDREQLQFMLRNPGVVVNACYVTDVRTSFGQPIPGRNATQECRRLESGAEWAIASVLDLAGLPEGSYLAHMSVDWTGSDGETLKDLSFKLPFQTRLEEIVDWVKQPTHAVVALGGTALASALGYAVYTQLPRWFPKAAPPLKNLSEKEKELQEREAELARREAELRKAQEGSHSGKNAPETPAPETPPEAPQDTSPQATTEPSEAPPETSPELDKKDSE